LSRDKRRVGAVGSVDSVVGRAKIHHFASATYTKQYLNANRFIFAR
jgi:hypothetical protein